MKASNIRKFIRDNEWESLTELVPLSAISILKSLNMTDRLRTISPPDKKKVIIELHLHHDGNEQTVIMDTEKSILENINNIL